MIRFELPDGAVKEFSSPVAASEVVRSISEGLLRAAVCVSVDGELLGLNEILDKGGSFKVLTFKDEEGKEVYRHTASHVLAQAIKRLYPDAKLAIGPAVKTGFYYDIDFFSADNPRRFQGYRGGNEQNRQIGFCRRKIRRFR